ncbi:MAG: SusE domain-containing protein [Bacteroidetes bacterium]|uniref:SusE domain-containing protein n=1 Tax=Candidatus Cryptobacteroides avicola TaxID=2840757 RepID=A0A940DS11_9BACT|nr:SusE domain-containing protein [Candidatus Cryptobacteroides avicola]
MKKILYMISAALVLCGLASCQQEETYSDLVPSDTLYLPRDNYSIDLSTGKEVILEWKSSGEGYVVYEVLFDTETGDFSNPLYVLLSANNGASPNITVTSSVMNTIAQRSGCLPGSAVNVKWTVRVWKGSESALYDAVRTISVTRANTVEPLPVEVSISGTATENDAAVNLVAATPVSDTKGSPTYASQVQREIGGFECFTRLDAGNFTVTDDQGRSFILEETGSIRQAEDGTVSENTTSGIYYLYLDFNTMRWSKKEIDKVEFERRAGYGAIGVMDYKGNGVWTLVDFDWGSESDSRYAFICYYKDGTSEKWGHFEDDCRQSKDPDSVQGYMNVYRFNNATVGEWEDTWKTKGDTEGIGKLGTFTVYMNNENSADYYHEHSFRDK